MALPPEKVKIKRKKDEDPVEALYIASEEGDENPKKRRQTEFIFRRLPAGEGIHAQNRAVSSGRISARGVKPEGVPQIHTTIPGEERLLGAQDDHDILYRLLAEEQSKGMVTDLPVRNRALPGGSTAIGFQKPDVQGPPLSSAMNDLASLKILQPRRFHLSKSSPVTPFPRSPVSGVQKRKKGGLKNEVAIFVEKEKRKLKRPRSLLSLVTAAASLRLDSTQKDECIFGISTGTTSMEGIETPTPNVTSPPKPRKRPLISAQEKHRLAEQSRLVAAHPRRHPETHRTADTIQADPNLWDYDSPKLAGELQSFVLQSINTQTQSPTSAPLKYKPKAPSTRLHDRETAAAADDTGANSKDADAAMSYSSASDDDEENYVYDTYVREYRSQAPELDPHNAHTKFGVLVISPEDREEWEAFADEGDESGNDFNSDEEDENAESFYGNDYPEDEVDSDDEYGRAAYERFRNRNASDDEEFDVDRDWNGEEEVKQRPWLGKDMDGDEEMS
ncbi:hypothetical protein FGG08_006761 [Glutinoglossum americanum]|uniref:Transcription factor Iwr1 domain-containing protein n=1 Tax=Glutinoglossum americanum TaxID=1670608 RepID=A0A9P8KX51_9PEZI|nr:hypothetical protein FGG08_006761 [Glutinoglossum americanum]